MNESGFRVAVNGQAAATLNVGVVSSFRGPQGDRGLDGMDAPQDAVRYGVQALDEAQQAQARGNIGAASAGELSRVKDDLSNKLPKSPSNWEPWTAEEQAAARDRIGIPKDYELIEEITVEDGVSVIFRTTEPDGTSYNFKKMYIRIGDDVNGSQIAIDDAAVRILANYVWGADQATYVAGYVSGTVKEIEAVVETGKFLSIRMVGRNDPYFGSAQMEKHSRGIHINNDRIRNITIGQYNGLTAGTVIKIWGVRADA